MESLLELSFREGENAAPLQSLREIQKVTSIHDSGSSGGIGDPSNKFPSFLLKPAGMGFWALPLPWLEGRDFFE